ncbi:unnamed protein product, partial [Vitis vinifera]
MRLEYVISSALFTTPDSQSFPAIRLKAQQLGTSPLCIILSHNLRPSSNLPALEFKNMGKP